MKILSLGAGVQSTAMLLMSDRGEIDRADYAIFADVGAEPKKVYDWLDYLTTQVSIPIIKTSYGNLYEDILKNKKFAAIPHFTWDENGEQSLSKRQCTADYKIAPIVKKTRELVGLKKGQRVAKDSVLVEMMIGISLDERHRMKTHHLKWIKSRWPLVEMRMSRGDCIKKVESILGKTPPRSSCVFCPFHNDKEWLNVKSGPPEEWQMVLNVENALKQIPNYENSQKIIRTLHPSGKPIDKIEFYDGADQLDMFGNECEGMCGV